MKRQVLFVQGGGEGAHKADAELVANLREALGPDYEVRFPMMPNESSPSYAAWKSRLEQEIAEIGDGVILVAHSVGATILVNALAHGEPSQAIAGLFLIAAPFVGEGGWRGEDFAPVKDLGARLPGRRSDLPLSRPC